MGTKVKVEVYESIMNGECDDDIDRLFAALKHRRSIVRDTQSIKMASILRAGDKVMLSGLSPKSLNGLTVEVIEVRRSRFTAAIPGRGVSTVPLSCATKV